MSALSSIDLQRLPSLRELFEHLNAGKPASELEELKSDLGVELRKDLLLITADHGNDPTIPSTDHTREYAPLLLASKSLPNGRDLGDRPSYADVGATVLDAFGLKDHDLPGESLL